MGRNKLIWVLFGLSALLVIISAITMLTAPMGIKEYDVVFIVSDGALGFDINNSLLVFGRIPPGGSGVREIVFENNRDEMIEIEILSTENIANFMSYQFFYSVPAKSKITIPIEVNIPENASEGKYEGKIRIQLR